MPPSVTSGVPLSCGNGVAFIRPLCVTRLNAT
jgi:hypothetical protein